MGLFNFLKKKEPETKPLKNTEPETKPPVTAESLGLSDPMDFFDKCLEDFHDVPMLYNLDKNGIIVFPDLIAAGKEVVLSLLKNPNINAKLKDRPEDFYYLIMRLSFKSGIALAAKWHEQPAKFDAYIDKILEYGPVKDADALIERFFSDSSFFVLENEFFDSLFDSMIKAIEPYLVLPDSRDYIFNALLATYQVGVSMVLDKFDYQEQY